MATKTKAPAVKKRAAVTVARSSPVAETAARQAGSPIAGTPSASAPAAAKEVAGTGPQPKGDRDKAKKAGKGEKSGKARKKGKAAPKAGVAAGSDEAKAPKKAKLIRDSFTMPEGDYGLITALKVRAMSIGTEVKKSELLRAGLQSLSKLSTGALAEMLAALPKVKTGRPQKKKKK